ncbi:MAG TPA: DUF1127 domain-containing protein [Acidisoma sp.]|uniref:DUF1127 domain-containing protein n=1 Tax=Acidisoma sp. TaxID=1872115 RepID=UPI002C507F18|nr:DUF1127 domain-containing protein [Acidisoma sp.]HTI03015.1 DUF1127 domain-containing protein [Acidisoma sp.]
MEDIDNATLSAPITQPRRTGYVQGLRGLLRAMWKAHRARRELAAMDDRFWADMGIGRGEVLMESRRPFWDLRNPADPTRRRRGD